MPFSPTDIDGIINASHPFIKQLPFCSPYDFETSGGSDVIFKSYTDQSNPCFQTYFGKPPVITKVCQFLCQIFPFTQEYSLVCHGKSLSVLKKLFCFMLFPRSLLNTYWIPNRMRIHIYNII